MRDFYTLKQIEEEYGVKDVTIRSYLSRGEIIPQSVVGKVGATTVIDKQFIDVFYGDLIAVRYKYWDCLKDKLSPNPKNYAEWLYLLGVFSLALDKHAQKPNITLELTVAEKFLGSKYIYPVKLAESFSVEWAKYNMLVDTYLSYMLAQWIKFVGNSEEKLEKTEYYKFFMQGWLEAVNSIDELKKVEI